MCTILRQHIHESIWGARNSSGRVIFAFYKVSGEMEVVNGEASALLFGLQLCNNACYQNILVEVDSEVLVS